MDKGTLIDEIILYSNALEHLGVNSLELLGEEKVSMIEQIVDTHEESEDAVDIMIKKFESKLIQAADDLIKFL